MGPPSVLAPEVLYLWGWVRNSRENVLDLNHRESSLVLPPRVLGRQTEMDGQAGLETEEVQDPRHRSGGRNQYTEEEERGG